MENTNLEWNTLQNKYWLEKQVFSSRVQVLVPSDSPQQNLKLNLIVMTLSVNENGGTCISECVSVYMCVSFFHPYSLGSGKVRAEKQLVWDKRKHLATAEVALPSPHPPRLAFSANVPSQGAAQICSCNPPSPHPSSQVPNLLCSGKRGSSHFKNMYRTYIKQALCQVKEASLLHTVRWICMKRRKHKGGCPEVRGGGKIPLQGSAQGDSLGVLELYFIFFSHKYKLYQADIIGIFLCFSKQTGQSDQFVLSPFSQAHFNFIILPPIPWIFHYIYSKG